MLVNRELSWLVFNERVLQEAQDPSVPLLQRLRFLGIFSNNRDEFIRVRVANLIRLSRLKGAKLPDLTGGQSIRQTLRMIDERMQENQRTFTETYTHVLSEMQSLGIRVIDEKELDGEQRQFCRDYYFTVVSQRLVPLILRKTTKIPFLRDGDIYHAVKMTAQNGKNAGYAIIQIPVSSSCPRFVVLPSPAGSNDIIFLDDIIRFCLDDIFFMFSYKNIAAYTFKVMRDAQLTLDDDISKSLMEKMEHGLESRMRGRPVRLIYDREMPDDLLALIATKLGLKKEEGLDAGGRYHLMRDLMRFPSIRPELEGTTPHSLQHPDVDRFASILRVVGRKDILLHYPYHTFDHLIDFLREAAIDPRVESICITLYRTAERSKVINALVNAARNGKKVLVLLELMARFDEEQNVENAELLQKEGVRVIHGVAGLKVHCKLILVERREKGNLRGYAYIGTGNFNESTARIYSDLGLLTADSGIVADVRSVFDFVALHRPMSCRRLLVAPYSMRDRFEELIDREIRNARKGKKSFIYAKVNSLTDEKMIRQLCKAGRAGVEVRLIVRGACCLQPGIRGKSDNIEIISIVDRYLEHARLFIFHGGGDEQVFISSADWMTRNLDRRVEVAVPVADRQIRKVLCRLFAIQWSDNVKARDLSVFGSNAYVSRNDGETCRSQMILYDFYAGIRPTDESEVWKI